MPLPKTGYRWRWARTDAKGWSDAGSPPTKGTWIAVPKAHAAKDSDAITVDLGSVRDKTSAELSAETQKRTRRQAFEHAVDAELQLLGLNALKTRLVDAGKNTTKIQTRIDKITIRLNKVIGNLP